MPSSRTNPFELPNTRKRQLSDPGEGPSNSKRQLQENTEDAGHFQIPPGSPLPQSHMLDPQLAYAFRVSQDRLPAAPSSDAKSFESNHRWDVPTDYAGKAPELDFSLAESSARPQRLLSSPPVDRPEEEPEPPLVDQYRTAEQMEEPELPPIRGKGKEPHPRLPSATAKGKGKAIAQQDQDPTGVWEPRDVPRLSDIPELSGDSSPSKGTKTSPLIQTPPQSDDLHLVSGGARTRTSTGAPRMSSAGSALRYNGDGRTHGPAVRFQENSEYIGDAEASSDGLMSSMTRGLRALDARKLGREDAELGEGPSGDQSAQR